MTAVSDAPLTVRNGHSGLRTMYWVFPDRESTRRRPMWQAAFWNAYEEVAAELGMRWVSAPPDAIAVDANDLANPKVYVAGERATPADSLFVTVPYTLPYQPMDVFNQYAIYAVLEQCGFYLPAPPKWAAVNNDKLATSLFLRGSPIPAIPTVRIGTGPDLGSRLYEPVLAGVTYPAIVKPTGWCSGWGVNLARTEEDLRNLLSLAQGGDTAMVVQPYLGAGTTDYRVMVVDGEPHTVARRSPQPGALVANYGRGKYEYAPMPSELAETVDFFVRKLPVPYFCVDFLVADGRFWLSEIELDGAIVCPDPDDPEAVRGQRAIIEARFRAYQKAHAAHLLEVSA